MYKVTLTDDEAGLIIVALDCYAETISDWETDENDNREIDKRD